MMKFSSAVVKILTVSLLMALVGTTAAQQPFPNKPIRFIAPYPPGSSVDVVGRLVAQKLNDIWRQPVLLDNRPGANTVIGTEALVKSPADGYTILLVSSAHVINPSLLTTPYDAIKDFAPVATLSGSELILVLHPSVPVNNLQELIALAKSKPGQLNHGSPGIGSPAHLAAELLFLMTGTKIQNVHYKGAGQSVLDLIGGQVQLAFVSPATAINHVKNGKLKAVAVSGETRLPSMPQVRTFTEAGLPGFDAKYWYGVLAPAGTPKGIIDKLSTEIAHVLVMPDVKEKLVSQGLESFVSTPEQFSALMKADMAKFAKVIKAANIKLEQ